MRRWVGAMAVCALLAGACGASPPLADPLALAAERRAAEAAAGLPASDVEADEPTTTTEPPTTTTTVVPSSTTTTSTPTETTQAEESPARDVCQSAEVGLAVGLPSGWSCEQVTTPVAGGTAFAVSSPEGTLTVTLGVGPHTLACELFDACGQNPIELSSQFSDTSVFTAGGITEISGTHSDSDAYLVVVSNSEVDNAALDVIAEVLDSVSSSR